jgi:hypothetical protein
LVVKLAQCNKTVALSFSLFKVFAHQTLLH